MTQTISEWSLRYKEDKRTTFQVRLSKEEREAIHQEARNRGITACELFRQYARYLMEDDDGQ
jgi:hypothetical protein